MARRKRIKHHEIANLFGQRLRAARKAAGVSQQDLAIRAGTTMSYVGKIERSVVTASLDTVGRLADALGVNPSELISRDPDPARALRERKKHAREAVEKLLGFDDESAISTLSDVAASLYSARARDRRSKCS